MSDIPKNNNNNGWGAALGILGGGMDLVNGAIRSAQIEDLTQYEDELSRMQQLGTQDYGNYGQVMQGYDQLMHTGYDVTADDIRGMNTGQKIGSIGTSTISGAMTGLQVSGGNPYAALAGAVVGLGSGVGGVVAGDQKAAREAMRLRYAQEDALMASTMNLNNAMEGLQDYNFRQGVAHRVAEGGPIERRQQSLKEFAANALRKPHAPEDYERNGIVRKKCDGGIMIRLKR